MKAIINVKKANQYSKFNGKTVEVVDVLTSIVAVNLNGITTDFSHKEVILVDIEEYFLRASMAYAHKKTPENQTNYLNLKRYVETNGIQL